MQFNRLSLKDKLIFDRYLYCKQHFLSAYAFENIFIWKNIYEIFWSKINKSLYIFFKDKVGCFLYLPPLGKDFNENAIYQCFKIMNRYNKNSIVSRIENIEEGDLNFYRNLGYKIVLSGCDYICKKEDLVNLKGNCFKNKRSAINFFIKNYNFKLQPYKDKDKKECISLYKLWMKARKEKNKDTIYQRLLDDNFHIFKKTLDYYNKLNFVGRTIKIANRIKAVTFGYPLTDKSFVILFEVCDLNFKGIAQYIFREFCRELNYQDINIMDDSGLANLRGIKLSYQPYKIMNTFIARNGS